MSELSPEEREQLARAAGDRRCNGIVTREGEQGACDKPTTAVIDGRGAEEETFWAVCAYHAHRYGRGRVVPLASIVTAAVEAERARIVSAVEAAKAALPRCVCYPAQCADFIDLSSPCVYCQARAALTVLASAAPALDAMKAEAEVKALRGAARAPLDDDAQAKVERVEALADDWERKAGDLSAAWRAFGPQTVSVPFAVQSIRAALNPEATDV